MNSPITRREAIISLASVAALSTVSSLRAAESPRSTAAGSSSSTSSSGVIRHSVCKWCYRDTPLETMAAAAKEIGLQSIELLGPSDFPTLK